jgi:hypothetical protein
MDGLLAGAAHSVQGCGGNLNGETSEQDTKTADVGPLLPGLGYAAGDDIFNEGGINADPVGQAAKGLGQQGIGPYFAVGSPATAEGQANGI